MGVAMNSSMMSTIPINLSSIHWLCYVMIVPAVKLLVPLQAAVQLGQHAVQDAQQGKEDHNQ